MYRSAFSYVWGVALIAWIGHAAIPSQAADDLSPANETNWRLRLFPCPHQLQWDGEIAIDAGKLVLLTPSTPSPVLETAVAQVSVDIARLCGQKPTVTTETPADAAYVLRFSEDPAANPPLPSEANLTQGYQILPSPDADVPTLILMGHDSAGVLYASQTLRQLLRADDQQRLLVPRVKIVDWPDLEDRGYFLDEFREAKIWDLQEWKRHIDWAAEQRFNVILLQITSPGRGLLFYHSRAFAKFIDAKHPLSAPGVLPAIIDYGRRRAVRVAPTIPHLDFFSRTLFRDHPGALMSVKGRGGYAGRTIREDRQEVDLQQPEAVEVLQRLVRDLVEVTQPDELSVWPTERPWFTPEEALVQAEELYKACQTAVKTQPAPKLRMLTTPTTLGKPAEMFRRLPRTVKIDYYDALKTYTLKGIKFRPEATQAMRDGGFHFSTMPAFGRFFWQSVPVIFPALTRDNAIASAEEGARGLVANGGDQPTNYGLNYAAGAEFAWNLQGRTVPEFTQAWARRQGWPKPARVADFYSHLEKAGIAFTLAVGEAFHKTPPISELETRVKNAVKGDPAKRRQRFIEPLQKALAEAEAAAAEAKAIGHERFTTEAEVIRSLTAAMLALHRGLAARAEGAADARKFFLAAQQEFKHLEAVWPTLQRLNPGTAPKGPMASYRRELPGFIATLSQK